MIGTWQPFLAIYLPGTDNMQVPKCSLKNAVSVNSPCERKSQIRIKGICIFFLICLKQEMYISFFLLYTIHSIG